MALAAIAIGAGARAAWIFWLHPPLDYLYRDMGEYLKHARDLVGGHDLNVYSTFQPAGTHFLLALPLKVFGTGRPGLWAAAVLWFLLSAATPFFVWRLARLLLTPSAAALATLFAAIWPLHVTYAGYFLSETPSLAFLVAALWLGYRAQRLHARPAIWQGALAGALGAVAVACRPQFLLNLALVAVPFLPRRRPNPRALLAFSVTAVALLAGVAAFNSVIAGRLTGLSREGGVTFYLGQCHIKLVTVRTPATFSLIGPPPYAQLGGKLANFTGVEIWQEGFFYRKGFHCIEDEGLHYPVHAARMIADMTATSTPWPQANESTLRDVTKWTNDVYGYVLLPLIVAMTLVRIARRVPTRQGEIALLAQLLCIVPVSIVFLGDPRFRVPYDVFGLMLLASALASPRLNRPERTSGCHRSPQPAA